MDPSDRGVGEALVEIAFEATVVPWRGPAPFVFVAVPTSEVADVREAARRASYGWGCVPVEAVVNGVAFTSSLFPRDGGYLLPLKAAVRTRAAVGVGDPVAVMMRVRARVRAR